MKPKKGGGRGFYHSGPGRSAAESKDIFSCLLATGRSIYYVSCKFRVNIIIFLASTTDLCFQY
ncbi:hypothetical protein NOC27_1749 [Nitrosococcus oceani AFC27]|uniref:Uncharacterized protein n=1 Tax=Nitrosococcus oceani C-27 TaxID=314279 RepID=A0A0E2Z8H7_9GAMM|nr:hypothetical protein NOC27_1749 [Nitrosococcus oceani AFC27]KFI19925.1 hypothetical protein IB75_05875 [Nitrosococcus oceani C-27]